MHPAANACNNFSVQYPGCDAFSKQTLKRCARKNASLSVTGPPTLLSTSPPQATCLYLAERACTKLRRTFALYIVELLATKEQKPPLSSSSPPPRPPPPLRPPP